jgi:hypothetical protein
MLETIPPLPQERNEKRPTLGVRTPRRNHAACDLQPFRTFRNRRRLPGEAECLQRKCPPAVAPAGLLERQPARHIVEGVGLCVHVADGGRPPAEPGQRVLPAIRDQVAGEDKVASPAKGGFQPLSRAGLPRSARMTSTTPPRTRGKGFSPTASIARTCLCRPWPSVRSSIATKTDPVAPDGD